MPESKTEAMLAGGWPEETGKMAPQTDRLAQKLRTAWCCLSRVTFGIAIVYPFYSTLHQVLRRLPLPSCEGFFFFLIGVAGIVAYALFRFITSDEDGWLISAGIPVALSIIAALVRAWISL